MKLKRIAAICRRDKHVVVYRSPDGGQYIGTDEAAYLVGGLPGLDEKSTLAILDVPEEDRSGWVCEIRGEPGKISIADIAQGEHLAKRGNIMVGYAGKELEPLTWPGGTMWIDTKFLRPLSGEEVELYIRRGGTGIDYVAAKKGMFLCAVIAPIEVSEKFLADLRGVTECTS